MATKQMLTTLKTPLTPVYGCQRDRENGCHGTSETPKPLFPNPQWRYKTKNMHAWVKPKGNYCHESRPAMKACRNQVGWCFALGDPPVIVPVPHLFLFEEAPLYKIPDQLPEVVMVMLSDHGNSFCLLNSIFFSTPSIMWGHSKAEAVGITVLVLWDNSLCPALDAIVSTGFFLYSKRASQRSLPSQSAFLNGSWWP